MKCSVEHESLSLTTEMFCEREKAKVPRNIIQQNDKSTHEVMMFIYFMDGNFIHLIHFTLFHLKFHLIHVLFGHRCYYPIIETFYKH